MADWAALVAAVRRSLAPWRPLVAALVAVLLLGLAHHGYWLTTTETDPQSVWDSHQVTPSAEGDNLTLDFPQAPGTEVTFKGRITKLPRFSTYRIDNMDLPENASAPGDGYHFLTEEGLALTPTLANRTLLWVAGLPILIDGNLSGRFYEGEIVVVRATLRTNLTANVLYQDSKVNLSREGWESRPGDVTLASRVDRWFFATEALLVLGGVVATAWRTPGLSRQLRGALLIAGFEMRQGLRSPRTAILILCFSLFISAMGWAMADLQELESDSAFHLMGPNGSLLKLCYFTFFILSLASVAVTFDAFQRERLSHTLDILLARPVSREAIVLGKALGISGSVGLPALLAQTAGVMLLTIHGGAPSPIAAAGYLVLGQVMIFTFVTLQLCFAVIARSGTTAAVAGLGVWIVFAVIWTLLAYMLAFALGIDIQQQGFENDALYQSIFSRLGLLNPGYVFQFAVGELMPRSVSTNLEGVSGWMVAVAMVAWPALTLRLATWLFRREERG